MHRDFLQRIEGHPGIKDSRQCGVILALDLAQQTSRYGNFRDEVMAFFMKRGIFLRPLGNTVYVLPPYVIKEEELLEIYAAIEALLMEL